MCQVLLSPFYKWKNITDIKILAQHHLAGNGDLFYFKGLNKLDPSTVLTLRHHQFPHSACNLYSLLQDFKSSNFLLPPESSEDQESLPQPPSISHGSDPSDGAQFSNLDHPSCDHLPGTPPSPTKGFPQAIVHFSPIFSRTPPRYLHVRMFDRSSGVQPGTDCICSTLLAALYSPLHARGSQVSQG